jgi:transposase
VVFSSKDTTVYVIRTSRGSDVPLEMLGDAFDGYLVVDGLKSYDVLAVAKGRCNAHLLRRCKELTDSVPPKEQAYVQRLSKLLQRAIALAQRRQQYTAAAYARRVQHLEDHLDDWLDRLPHSASADLDRLANHVAAHRGEWFTFLHDPEVPGGSRTWVGARAQSALMSVWRTCWQQGHSALDFLSQLLRGMPVALAMPT